MRVPIRSPRDQYLDSLFPIVNRTMVNAREASATLGAEGISLSSPEVAILKWALRACGVRKMIEIGTLTGFSGLGLLEALPSDGTLWTFEKSPQRAALAEKFLVQGLSEEQKVYVLQGDAEQELKSIEQHGPFDGIFIDGNKLAYGAYLDWAELNLRPGGLILADNVFLSGAVYGEPVPHFSQKQINSMREFNQRLSDPTKYFSCVVPSFEGLFMSILLPKIANHSI